MDIPVVMSVPERQIPLAKRLVDFCKSLDGTDVRVLVTTPEMDREFRNPLGVNQFPNLQGNGFRRALKEMHGQAFFWLETDSIPLKPNWLRVLSLEYEVSKKEMLVPVLRDPRELGAGIGIYGPNTLRLIPEYFRYNCWDWWILHNIPSVVGITRSVHHSYGEYHGWGAAARAKPHEFPRDDHIIDPAAWVFHKDAKQGLLGRAKPLSHNTYWHSGDLGDIIAFLPVMRHVGGGNLALGTDPLGYIRPFTDSRRAFIEPLLRVQPWIRELEFRPPAEEDIDMNRWRLDYGSTRTLTASQGAYIGDMSVPEDPWLVAGNPPKGDHIVFTRSPRYHNPAFPWRDAWTRYRQHAVFMGDPSEHEAFCKEVGKVPYRPVADALEMAQVIASARLMVCNQSVPYWIAAGLGTTPIIQETHTVQLDSQVKRPDAQYFRGQAIRWPRLE